MDTEKKYNLIKEKYKEIKEQNDILKKAIIEYKKDINELEKKNDEQSNKINIIVNENQTLLINNKKLSNKIVQLNTSLEEQKKNIGWHNFSLIKKQLQDNNEVAFEELENKINENELLHKKIDALQSEYAKKNKEIEIFTKSLKEKINEKEKIITELNEKIELSNYNIKKIEEEKNEIIKEINLQKELCIETLEKKKEEINELEIICEKLKKKCFFKYKIALDKIPFIGTYNYYDIFIQNEINKNLNEYKCFILCIVKSCIKCLLICKELFLFNDIKEKDFSNLNEYKNINSNDTIKINHFLNISKNIIIVLDEIINVLIKFTNKWNKNKENNKIMNIIHILTEKIKLFFIKLNAFLYLEDYYFPQEVSNIKFRIKNIIDELRILKCYILKSISLFCLLLLIKPYNNNNIISEYLNKFRIKKKKDDINSDKYIYYNDINHEENKKINLLNLNTDEMSENSNEEINNDHLSSNEKLNFVKLIAKKEQESLSKFDELKNYNTKNYKIYIFLIECFKNIYYQFIYILEFFKSYISFKMCNKKVYKSVIFDNSKIFLNLSDYINDCINSFENFDISKINIFLISLMSYYRFQNYTNLKEKQNYLTKINQAFNNKNTIPYNILLQSYNDLQLYKENYLQINKQLLKKKEIIKKMKIKNKEILNEYKNISLINKNLNSKNQTLIHFFSNKCDNKNEIKNDIEKNNDLDTQNILKNKIDKYHDNVEIYADKILNFILKNFNNKNLKIKEKQILEAYIISCIKINNLQLDVENNKKFIEQLKNNINEKENENKNLNIEIEKCKNEETNIHKKYEEQMNALYDLIISLEKQITRLNDQKDIENTNKFIIVCSICGNRNNIGNILNNRKCLKCNSINLYTK